MYFFVFDPTKITIPSVFIKYESGQQILTLLSNSSLIGDINAEGESRVCSILSYLASPSSLSILTYIWCYILVNVD